MFTITLNMHIFSFHWWWLGSLSILVRSSDIRFYRISEHWIFAPLEGNIQWRESICSKHHIFTYFHISNLYYWIGLCIFFRFRLMLCSWVQDLWNSFLVHLNLLKRFFKWASQYLLFSENIVMTSVLCPPWMSLGWATSQREVPCLFHCQCSEIPHTKLVYYVAFLNQGGGWCSLWW